ncbi:MAG: SDR family oxidoreductase [Gammaproteobacteria bacterium]|jgi:NAD(P)-dependent dehydrogenase (short-subunit alcohol dehydrogenase family)|nr:short-chain dehydrogenase [Chromatiales bacterium]MDP6674024.1 SDR family oxidoreductase [Gammaproteobacteria bacterium]
MPTVLITGANRGLGLEFTRQYLDCDWQVIACTRKPNADELLVLPTARLRICELDVTNHAIVDQLAGELQDMPIDVLINNAGTSGPKGAPECMAYSGFNNMDFEIWRQILEINLLGTFKVATAFRSNLVKSERGILVNMSSDLGSVAQNSLGNLYSYRTSKAGLNMMTMGFSKDWPDIVSVAMAPGWCRTELGGEGAEIAPEDSVCEQIRTIGRLTAEYSGCFIDHYGEPVPW